MVTIAQRWRLDIIMTIGLICCMSYSLIGKALHEWIAQQCWRFLYCISCAIVAGLQAFVAVVGMGARSWQRALRARLLRDTWAHRFKPDAFGVCVRLSAAGAAGRRWSDTAPGLRLLGIFLHRAASWTTRTVCTDHACAAFSPASAFLASVSRAHLCRRRRCVFLAESARASDTQRR